MPLNCGIRFFGGKHMKRFFIFLILLLLTFNTYAINAYPGDTITIPVSINTTDAYFVGLTFSYDPEIFEFIANHCSGPNTQFTKHKMMMYDIWNPIPSGQIGTITLLVKENAPAGNYRIPVGIEAWTFDEEIAKISVYIDEVNVMPAYITIREKLFPRNIIFIN